MQQFVSAMGPNCKDVVYESYPFNRYKIFWSFRNFHSSIAMKIFAQEGATGDPITLPWFCRKCSLLNESKCIFVQYEDWMS